MPMSNTQAQALPGIASGSRKRPHAEITRSESRSQSPHPPCKRRRTLPSPHLPDRYSSRATPHFVDGRRHIGDGFDYRRPAMSTPPVSQPQSQDTIDLTIDDESPPPRLPSTASFPPESNTAIHNRAQEAGDQGLRRAPPFVSQNGQSQPVINLSSDDEDESQSPSEGGTRLVPSSPEVQFIGERVRPQPLGRNNEAHGRPHLPPPPAMGHFGSMANFLRDMTQNGFFNFRGARGVIEPPEEALNRVDGFFNHHPIARQGLEEPPDDMYDEFDGLQMDYNRAAFNIGPDLLVIEDPNLRHIPANRANESAYKEPPAAKEGFTRNYAEDDMLVCGLCGDELATGPTEQKQQVWIVKQCGHAYCGDCAHSRSFTKQKNNKDPKRSTSKKGNGFKICAIPDCNKTVDSKTKMFQIYL